MSDFGLGSSGLFLYRIVTSHKVVRIADKSWGECVPFAETECICRYGVAAWVLQEEIEEKEGCVASGGEGVGWSKRNVPLRLKGEVSIARIALLNNYRERVPKLERFKQEIHRPFFLHRCVAAKSFFCFLHRRRWSPDAISLAGIGLNTGKVVWE